MPTFWTRTLIPTLRQTPAEAEVPSHRLMLRAGYIHRLGSGVYDYLPLGLRSLQKVMAIIREEMAEAGAVEVMMPALQPIDLWEKTGRREAYGENLFVVKDRHGRDMALGPTHEEIITNLVGEYVESYRQLPLTLYQIQTKFRDEFRPRFGVLRSREFQMKDAYSFDLTLDGLDATYQAQYEAYKRIFERCGLPYEIVEAEAGPIGGNASHEFMVPSPTGEDIILKSDKGNYAANVEKAEIGVRNCSESLQGFSGDHCTSIDAGQPTGEVEKVHTPGCPGIEDVCAFFKKNLGTKLKQQNMLKTIVFEAMADDGQGKANPDGPSHWALAVVRGDHEVNEAKVRGLLKARWGAQHVELAEEARAKKAGFAIGFVGPHAAVGRDNCCVLIDPDAGIDTFWVTGANEADHHIKHFNWQRDLIEPIGERRDELIIVADVRNAVAGDPSPKNDGGILEETRGIEIGHVFKLGTKYTDALGVQVLDESNEKAPVIMGCYGIGVNRILASAIERDGGNDDNGIIWPASIAPYKVVITAIKYEGEAKEAVLGLAAELESHAEFKGEVLIDDRDERPGVKFKDADLIGIPVRVVIGDKGLANGEVELAARDGSLGQKGEMVPVGNAVARIREVLAGL